MQHHTQQITGALSTELVITSTLSGTCYNNHTHWYGIQLLLHSTLVACIAFPLVLLSISLEIY
jgi:hypothetical protein